MSKRKVPKAATLVAEETRENVYSGITTAVDNATKNSKFSCRYLLPQWTPREFCKELTTYLEEQGYTVKLELAAPTEIHGGVQIYAHEVASIQLEIIWGEEWVPQPDEDI